MTIHSNTAPLFIYIGTLQGDTLSPFLFTIFIETLLRWLAVSSRGYKPTCQQPQNNLHNLHLRRLWLRGRREHHGGIHPRPQNTTRKTAPLQPIHRAPDGYLKMRSHRIALGAWQPPQPHKPDHTTRTNQLDHICRRYPYQIPTPKQIVQNARGPHQPHVGLQRTLPPHHQGRKNTSQSPSTTKPKPFT